MVISYAYGANADGDFERGRSFTRQTGPRSESAAEHHMGPFTTRCTIAHMVERSMQILEVNSAVSKKWTAVSEAKACSINMLIERSFQQMLS